MSNQFIFNEKGDLLVGCDKGIAGKITIPAGITKIGVSAFLDCKRITGVIIPEGVTEIGQCAFWGCENLNFISLPKSLEYVDLDAFVGCEKRKTVEYRGSVSEWCDIEFTSTHSSPFYPSGSLFVGGCIVKRVDVPSTANNNVAFSFAGCNSITVVTIEKGLKRIGQSAFSGCKNLSTVVLPEETLQAISYRAFYRCNSLSSMDIPKGVRSIEKEAFSQCEKLLKVNLPDGLTTIQEGAFSFCPQLKHLYIPKSVLHMDKNIAIADPPRKGEVDIDGFNIYCEGNTGELWSSGWNRRYSNLSGKEKHASVTRHVPRTWYNKYINN